MIRFQYIIWVCIGLCSPVFILAWTEADNIANTPERSNYPAITTDNDGDVYVVWSEDYLEIGKIFYTHYDGLFWSEPIDISRNELWWPLYAPDIEVDGTGRIHVVWDCNSSEIYWSYCDGDTWSIPVNISNTPGGSTGPRTAIDRYGRIHLVWHDNTTGRCEVYYCMYDGESWQEPQRITNGIGEKKNFWPDTDVDSSGYTHVVWGHYGGTGSELDYWIQYSRYNGISWTSPVDILRIEGKHMAEADIVIDIEDHPHVVAEKWNYNGIYYTRYNGETWSEPYLIYEGNHAGRPDIAIEPSNGLGCVVWGCRYYRFFNDTIWDSAGCIVGPDGVLPSLTAGIGTFHLVWASGDIWYSKHTVTGIESLEDSLQKEIELKSIPNPFDSGIMVQFALFEKIGVVIKVYNALGQEVKVLVNDLLCSGPYEVVWDGKDNLGRTVSCGVYFLRFTTGEYIATQKLLKVR